MCASPSFSFGSRTILNYAHVAVLIRNMPVDDPMRYGILKDHICYIANGLEARTLAMINELRSQERAIRIQTTAADVIHAFAVPSLWFKLDAVPGRLNEKRLMIKEPGIYYGQCSELCGAKHGYMPIAVEALPRPQFEAWVRAQGGTVGEPEEAAAPAAAPVQQPESAAQQPAAEGAAPAAAPAA